MTPPDDRTAADDLLFLLKSWERKLRAEKLSANTLRTYRQGVQAFARHLRGLPDPPAAVEDITREHVESWVIAMAEASPDSSTPRSRFGQIRTYFRWLATEGEIDAPPTDGMKEPKVTAKLVPVVATDALRALLATCDSSFLGRRDEALLRAYADGGMRLNECATLDVDDVDMDQQVFFVRGKGGKVRAVPFGNRTARALDRYLRARRKHPHAKDSTRLWLSRSGTLSGDGFRRMLDRRCRTAGLGHIRPHQLRHTSAHQVKKAGMSDQDMRRIFGWSRNSRMPDRYGESAADERALEAHRRLSFGDQL